MYSIFQYLKRKRKKKHLHDGVATTPSFFNYVYTKRRDLDEALPHLEVVAVGSSLADYGFYSPSWANSYNFGLTSGDLFVALQQYEKILRHAPNLKVVLLYVGVFMPGFNLGCTSERNRLILYKHFFGIPYNEVNKLEVGAEEYVVKKMNESEIQFSDSLQGYVYDKSHLSKVDVIKRAKKHFAENRRLPDQMGLFRRLKQLVESDGKDIYLIIPPVRSDYRDALEEMTPEDLFEGFRSSMSECHIFDFYEDKEFIECDFGDCDHMSRSGAQKLTAKIYSKITT
jgi:hypothetical protein